eukprot:TRINITY_DN775959_c0_g1_i1.p1 TRINITY_DN775959_c0_g1~~TRINITY_DN775959_c0_g1_i1.p1  ORF type:complete len:332 (-),score=34.49 TRINITY_DN775959_c0_g1_i1:181-1125(-)
MNKDNVAFSAAGGKGSGMARVIGSTTAGLIEVFGFHPVDTTAKRLMSNTGVWRGANNAETMVNLNKIIFKDAATAGAGKKFLSMFPGLGFAATYKILQRIYKFGGQPYARDFLNKYYDSFANVFGQKKARSMVNATAGCFIGIGEVALLPLDVLKIKSQTNPEVLKGRGVMDLFAKEKFGLYRGIGWTMARNAPGSFALFGGCSVVYDYLFQLENQKDATFGQNFVASIAGAICSILVSSPLDTIKTRIQNKPFNSPETGVEVISKLLKNEGPTALFKGVTPKMAVIGPKLIFSFTIAQWMINYVQRRMDAKNE